MLMEILEKQEDLKLEQYVTDIKNSVTLDSIVLAVFKFVLYIGSILLNEIVSERAKQHVERPNCPHCNSPLDRKDWLPRKMTTLLGLIMWDRLAWRCPKGCKIGQITPYDKALGIRPYQETSNDIKRMVCLLAVFVPFGIASLIFKKLTGIEISDKSIWNWVQEAGEKGIQKVNEELKKLNDGVDPELRELDPDVAELPMVIGGDGVTVPFRPNEGSPKGKTKWCIVNVGIIARIGSKLTKTGKKISIIVRRRVIAVLDNINIFKNHMHLEALKEGVNNAKQVAWLSDGGPGFWGVFRELFSKLKNVYGILDFYHAAQNVYKGAKAKFDGRTINCKEWFEKVRKKLRLGNAAEIIQEIKKWLKIEEINRILNKGNLSDEVVRILTNVFKYLEAHADHINYDHYKSLGLPIGSGLIESACKWVVQQRFKGVGMRWSRKGFKNLLHLRVAFLNGNFDDIFVFP